ncbi:MAG: OsmC family protein [Anaerolineales bacterium]|jgi:osmotically inducible protein OsmC
MPVRKAEAFWKGTLREGSGSLMLGSGMFEGPYSFPSRFEQGPGTNPEELLGAAHAGCFSMSLASGLSQAGLTPTQIHSTAHVHLEKTQMGFRITRIELDCQAEVPGIDPASFLEHAQTAKANCPVSRALAGVEITLKATLME